MSVNWWTGNEIYIYAAIKKTKLENLQVDEQLWKMILN